MEDWKAPLIAPPPSAVPAQALRECPSTNGRRCKGQGCSSYFESNENGRVIGKCIMHGCVVSTRAVS